MRSENSNQASEYSGEREKEVEPDLYYRTEIVVKYDGHPYVISRVVTCKQRTIKGGSLGQTADLTTRKSYPASVGKVMHDGSFLALRLPDLCLYNRKYETGKPRVPATRLANWEEGGAFSIFPLLVWANDRRHPNRIEEYISPGYYNNEKTRVDIERSTVQFYLRNTTVPIDKDLNLEDDPLADNVIRMGHLVERKAQVGDAFLAVAAVPYIKNPSYVRSEFDHETSDALKPSAEKSGTRFKKVKQCIERLQFGKPDISNLRPEPYLDFAPMPFPDRILRTEPSYRSRYNNIKNDDQYKASCYRILEKLIPFENDAGKIYKASPQRGLLIFFPRNSYNMKSVFPLNGINYRVGESIEDSGLDTSYKIDQFWNLILDPHAGQ